MEYHVILGFIIVIIALWTMGKISSKVKREERAEVKARSAAAHRAAQQRAANKVQFVESTRQIDRPGQDWTKF